MSYSHSTAVSFRAQRVDERTTVSLTRRSETVKLGLAPQHRAPLRESTRCPTRIARHYGVTDSEERYGQAGLGPAAPSSVTRVDAMSYSHGGVLSSATRRREDYGVADSEERYGQAGLGPAAPRLVSVCRREGRDVRPAVHTPHGASILWDVGNSVTREERYATVLPAALRSGVREGQLAVQAGRRPASFTRKEIHRRRALARDVVLWRVCGRDKT